MATSNPDMDRFAAEAYKTWEKAMTTWWDQVLESPAFLGQMNQGLAGAASARGAYTRAVDQWMEQAHLPTREDIVRLLKICSQLEDRLLGQEDLLLELKDKLAVAEKEALEARVAAAEARVELRERLAALEARLAASPSGPAPAAPARRRKEG